MKAVVLDPQGLRHVGDYTAPEAPPGWARVRVMLAGICKTDLELVKGYAGFSGIPGHEFLGRVESSDAPEWIGRRVVGEINVGCGACHWCAGGMQRHCPERRTLGIRGLNGCMAEFCVLPTDNLLEVGADIPDERAIFAEPLAAACEILEQIPLQGHERVVVLGDGRLGILCAWALATRCADVSLVGHHPEKLALASWRGIKTFLGTADIAPGADLVVEATGSVTGIGQAMSLCRARGIIVLKTTLAQPLQVDLSALVVNEQNIVGSRCGRLGDALSMMRAFPDMPLARLVSARLPLSRVGEAFELAGGGALKVLLDPAA